MIYNAQCSTMNKLSHYISEPLYNNCFLVNYMFIIFIISVILQKIFLSCPLSCSKQLSFRYMCTRTLQDLFVTVKTSALHLVLQLTSCGTGSIPNNGSFHHRTFIFFFPVLFCLYFLGTASTFWVLPQRSMAFQPHGCRAAVLSYSVSLLPLLLLSFLSIQNTFKRWC